MDNTNNIHIQRICIDLNKNFGFLCVKVVIGGNNQKYFFDTVSKVKDGVQSLLKSTSPNKDNKDEYSSKVASLKLKVVSKVQQLLNLHTNPPNTPVQSGDVTPILLEVYNEIKQFLGYVHKFMPKQDQENLPRQAEINIVETTSKLALEYIREIVKSTESNDQAKFSESTAFAVESMKPLLASKSIPDSESLKQNFVSIISHSKMYFVNGDDEYVKEKFQALQIKIQNALKSFLSEDSLREWENYEKLLQEAEVATPKPRPIPPSRPLPTLPPTERSKESRSSSTFVNNSYEDDDKSEGRSEVRTRSRRQNRRSTGSCDIKSLQAALKRVEEDEKKKRDSGDVTSMMIDTLSSSPVAQPINLSASSSGLQISRDNSRIIRSVNDFNNTPPSSTTAATSTNTATNAAPSKDNVDIEFTKNIIALVKQTWNVNTESNPDKAAKFEQTLLQTLKAYKSLSIANSKLQDIQRTTTSSQFDPQKIPKKALEPTTSKIGLNPLGKTKSRSFEEPVARAVELRIGGGMSTPRTKVSQQLSEHMCGLLKDVAEFVVAFDDKGLSFVLDMKPDVRDETKDILLKKKVSSRIKTLVGLITEALEMIPKTASINGESFSTGYEALRAKIAEKIKPDRTGESGVIEPKLYQKGQYTRWIRQTTLESIYQHTLSLYYLTSQVMSIMYVFNSEDIAQNLQLLVASNTFYSILCELSNDIEILSVVILEEAKSLSLKQKQYVKSNKSDSIWKEKPESDSLDKTDLYRPGTLNALIIRLTASAFNSDLMATFLAGYELFSSPSEVWEKIEERYNVPSSSQEHAQAQFVKLRVASVIFHWVKQDFYAIDLPVLAAIKNFAEKELEQDKFIEVATWITQELNMKDRFAARQPKNWQTPLKIPIFQFTSKNPYEILISTDQLSIAEQLTLIEIEIFQRITRIELTDQKWSKDKYFVLSRNARSIIQHINKISFLVATSLILQKRLQDRVKVLQRVIGICKALADLKNFNSLMGILAGLGLSAVSRLRHTWSKLPTKFQEV
eukprot:TRINITY_DN443_c0_g2_i2.p1 TRINITY_DN443_c0_g2~~TRINITY_DN443_c0_g2_i2.p1  ORF type:complete len:1021 (+),score=272.43 TRINITY_DN443_c0_g2_i2:26-3088(+)